MPSFAHAARWAALAGCMAATTAGSAQAGVLDFLFGSSNKDSVQAKRPESGRKSWRVGEFSDVKLAPLEPGAPANNHPVTLSTNLLRDLLNQIRISGGSGAGEPLFAREELDELVDALAEALMVAGPREDLVFNSSSRRGGGILSMPYAVTARLFVQGDKLSIIVHDSRFDFFGEYRGSNKPPVFVYGSRATAGTATIDRAGASRRRADWLEMPLTLAASPAVTVGMPAAPAAPGMPAPPAAVAAPVPAPAAAPPAPVPNRPRDAGFFEEQEQRLAALKRLREKGLITEEEYQQKRAEILKSL